MVEIFEKSQWQHSKTQGYVKILKLQCLNKTVLFSKNSPLPATHQEVSIVLPAANEKFKANILLAFSQKKFLAFVRTWKSFRECPFNYYQVMKPAKKNQVNSVENVMQLTFAEHWWVIAWRDGPFTKALKEMLSF